MNDGQECNMMILVGQIRFKAILPRARAAEHADALRLRIRGGGRLENAPRAEQRSALDNLGARFPNTWFRETALGTFLVHGEGAVAR